MITMTEDQQHAMELFLTGENILLLGGSGTGKTTLVEEIINIARNMGRRVAATASTGIAALLLPEGQTIHRLLKARPHMNLSKVDYGDRAALLEQIDVLIIDEISMIGARFIQYLYRCIHAVSHQVQLIVVGDFYQIPPVKDDYAFKSTYWKQLKLVPCFLKKVVRQSDAEMVRNINLLKMGDTSCLEYFRAHSNTEKFENTLTICARIEEAGRLNREALAGLDGAPHIYCAHFEAKPLEADIVAEKFLALKVGSRVMTIINEDLYKNGSLGTVTKLTEHSIEVLFDSGARCEFGQHVFEARVYNDFEKVTTYSQFPLRPAHAITIHKSQGQTFEQINIDGRACWAPGQLYVAISRAKTTGGIYFQSPISEGNVRTDFSVTKYYKEIEQEEETDGRSDVVGY